MSKQLILLANLTFIMIQIILFIIFLKRYINEMRKLKEISEQKKLKISNSQNDIINFLYGEIKFSYKLIKANINNKLIILNEIEHCINLLEEILGKKKAKELELRPINLKKLIYELKEEMYKLHIILNCDIDNDYFIIGDYELLKKAFTLIIKYYYKDVITIKIKKYGNFFTIEFISKNTNQNIESNIVIDYINEIISKHKGIIKIKEQEELKIIIIIFPLKKSPKTF